MTAAIVQGESPHRKVGWLWIGIVVMPYIFAWFLLRRGYSIRARVVSFIWMAMLVFAFAMKPTPGATGAKTASTGATSVSPDNRSFSQVATDSIVDPQMNAITDKVARDSVAQYELTQKGGDKVEICVRAGMVAAAYNQAKDEANYLLWKQKERNDCSDAGMPQH